MRSLSSSQLLSFLAAGAILGLSAVQLSTGFGFSFPASPASMIITLPIIGIAVLLASLPIARYRRQLEKYQEGPRPQRPNPFYAVRVLVISRATALTGALFSGWHLGALVWLFSFSVAPAALVTNAGFGLAAALIMLGGGMIAEQNCKAPRDPGEGAE